MVLKVEPKKIGLILLNLRRYSKGSIKIIFTEVLLCASLYTYYLKSFPPLIYITAIRDCYQ